VNDRLVPAESGIVKSYNIDWDEDILLKDLAAAENANQHARPCQVCTALGQMSDRAKTAVERALEGTIGEIKLADILTGNGYPTGRRAVATHRREGHLRDQ